jgi:hypothetical protein
MTISLDSFLASTEREDGAPADPALRALWLDARGAWDRAHKCVDALSDPDAMWVHAFLHRKEGDQGNAGYWYRRAGRPPHRGTLEQEWREIATALLDKGRA